MKRFLHIAFVFVLCFSLFVPVSYAVDNIEDVLPSVDGIDIPNKLNAYTYYNDRGNIYLVLLSDVYNNIENKGAEFKFIKNGLGAHFAVYLEDDNGTQYNFKWFFYKYNESSNNWSYVNSSTQSSLGYAAITIDDIYYNSHDIYNEDGTVFFQGAPTEELYQMILKVMTEELQSQSLILVGTMKILTVCGVGLIALLVVLNLFGKVLRIFHLK